MASLDSEQPPVNGGSSPVRAEAERAGEALGSFWALLKATRDHDLAGARKAAAELRRCGWSVCQLAPRAGGRP